MARAIYIVYACIVDANGTWNTLSGYPKTFDSKNYNNDVQKTLLRAEGEFSDTYGTMCKRDDRQVQTVILMRVDGIVIDSKTIGELAENKAPDEVPDEE